LIHHDDLRAQRPDRVDLKDYPPAIIEHLVGQRRVRRDPVIRGCMFAYSAFLWSELARIMRLDRQTTSASRWERERD
jgi:LuxR family quorum-sensing system transcriptional regulator CciR